MYKRCARILFVDTDRLSCSLMAWAWSRQLGADRIEARTADIGLQAVNPAIQTVMREVGIDITDVHSPRLTSDMLAWADLVVTISGSDSKTAPAPLPPGVQGKLWRLGNAGATPDLETWRRLRDTIRDRIESMIGGMNMLKRMDQDEPAEGE